MNEEQLQQVIDLLEAANSELMTLGESIPDDDESDARQHYNNASAQVQEALGILNNS
jgi:CRISPR/Cas system CSM-associated protein Csm4 (group 5 of RAMP superfamily)